MPGLSISDLRPTGGFSSDHSPHSKQPDCGNWGIIRVITVYALLSAGIVVCWRAKVKPGVKPDHTEFDQALRRTSANVNKLSVGRIVLEQFLDRLSQPLDVLLRFVRNEIGSDAAPEQLILPGVHQGY